MPYIKKEGGRRWNSQQPPSQTLPYEAWLECHTYQEHAIRGSTEKAPRENRGKVLTISVSDSQLVQQKGIIERDIVEIVITAGRTAVAGSHVRLQQQGVVIGFGRAKF